MVYEEKFISKYSVPALQGEPTVVLPDHQINVIAFPDREFRALNIFNFGCVTHRWAHDHSS